MEIELGQVAVAMRRATHFLENGMPKTELIQVVRNDVGTNKPSGVFHGNIFIKSLWKGHHLISIETLDVVHRLPRVDRWMSLFDYCML
jgi:hypothetical protein